MLAVALLASAILSYFLHRHVRSFARACIATALAATLLAFLSSPHFGWLDSTYYENLLIFGLTSLGAAIVVGLWLQSRPGSRKQRK